MKKLMPILGAFFFASLVLTSCGGNPEAAAEAERECDCAAWKIENPEKRNAALEKCEEMIIENTERCGDDEDAFGALFDARNDVLDIPCRDR